MDFVCFGSGDVWGKTPTSRYHLISRLSENHRFLYVESIGIRRPQARNKDIKKIFQKLKSFFKGARIINRNLWVITPIIIPLHGNKCVVKLNELLLSASIRYYMTRMNMTRPCLWANIPSVVCLFTRWSSPMKLYYCPDRFAEFPGVDKHLIESWECDIVRASDAVVASAQSLVDYLKSYGKDVHYIPHGVDYSQFAGALTPGNKPFDLLDVPGKIVLYYGMVEDWFDFESVCLFASRNPEVSVVILGKIATDISSAAPYENIRFLGFKDYKQLPDYLRFSDCCILPFKMDELINNVNPLKVREYLAAGRPVVASPLKEIKRYAEHVLFYRSPEDFNNCVLKQLSDSGKTRWTRISESVKNESWDSKARQLEQIFMMTLAAQQKDNYTRQ